jgi:universal stress protein E
MEQRRAELDAQIEALRPDGMQVEVIVAWDKFVHLWVDAHARRTGSALVVKTGHRSETFLYTPTDWHLLRECEAPVLIAADHIWQPTRSVVAAVDLGSHSHVKQDLNEEIIATAKRYADALGYPVHLVYVIHISAVLKDLHVVDEEAHVEKIRGQMQPLVADLAKTHGIAEEQIHIEHGEVDAVIAATADSLQAQLVVMGTVGRHGLNAKLVGNTAERVLTRLETDVLALKPGTGKRA